MRININRLYRVALIFILLLFCLLGNSFSGEAAAPGEILLMAPQIETRFSPDAENWVIPFELLDTSKSAFSGEVNLKKIQVDRVDLDLKKVELGKGRCEKVPVVPAGRHIPREDLLAWHNLSAKAKQQRGVLFNAVDRRRAELLHQELTQKIATTPELDLPANEIIVPVGPEGLFVPVENESYEVAVCFELAGGKEHLGFSTTVHVVSLPNPTGNSQWLPGDLHIHTNYSDGGKSVTEIRDLMKGKGYRFVYLSDGHHTGKLLPHAWKSYQSAVAAVSQQDPGISIFPGVETGVGVGDHEGHLLAHGTNNHIEGLEEYILPPQTVIDLVAARDPDGPSSSCVPHATNPFMAWKDYNVIGYHGFELMMLMPFTSKALDAALVVKWREEVARQLDNAITGSGTFPSPRTGTDYHGKLGDDLIVEWYVTWVYSAEYWDNPPLGHHQRKSTIDHSLRWGHTVASHKGSFAQMTLDGKIPGSIIRNVPAGTVMPLFAEFYSVRNGAYRLRVFRDNVAETVFEATCSDVKAGDHFTWEGEITFPGGNHYYWVYLDNISGEEENVYASPIFVTSLGPEAPSIEAPAGWRKEAAVPVSITHGDNAVSTEYRLEGATEQDWVAYSSPFELTAEGETVITARSIDEYGGVSESATAVVKLDRTPPIIEIDAVHGDDRAYREGSWTNLPVTVAADFSDSHSGVDSASAKYSLNGGSLTAYKGPLTISDDGEHELILQVTDIAGNTAESSFYVKIDRIPPKAPVLQLSTTNWTRDDVILTLAEPEQPDEGSGLAKMSYRCGTDGEWIDYESPVSLSAEGETIIYGRSEDRAGNRSVETSKRVRIDRTPPQVEIELSGADGTVYEPGNWSLQPVQLEAIFSDELSGVPANQKKYSLDGGSTWQYYTGPLLFEEDGAHQIIIRAADFAGNETLIEPITVKVDRNPPTAPQIELSDTGWTRDDVSFTLIPGSDSGSGVDRSQYRIGCDGAWIDYDGPVMIAQEGSTIIYARTVDRVGRVSVAASAEVKIDRTPPQIGVEITGEDGTVYEPGDCSHQLIYIDVAFTDPLGEIAAHTRQYSFDGGDTWLDYEAPLLLEEEGDYNILFRVEDRAGNSGENSLGISICFAIPVTGVSLEPAFLVLFLGEENTAVLTATVEPAGATDKSLAWSSADPRVVSVDEGGLVTAHSPGETQITVETIDGGYCASADLRVVLRGDVTMDGKVDVGDAIVILRRIVGLVQLSEIQKSAADMNEDGKIDVSDAILLLRCIVGLT